MTRRNAQAFLYEMSTQDKDLQSPILLLANQANLSTMLALSLQTGAIIAYVLARP